MRALNRAGHEVELFATGGSIPPEKGNLHYNPTGDWTDVWEVEKRAFEMYRKEIFSCDIVDDRTLTKMVHHWAYHDFGKKCVMVPWGTGCVPPHRNDYGIVTWSAYQRGLFLQQGCPKSTKFVHGAVEVDMFEPSADVHDYIVYLARCHPSKRTELVIRLAKEMGFRLVICADTESPDHQQYLQEAQVQASGSTNIVFFTNPTFKQKLEVLRHARGYILPSYGECFGLGTVEALASGVPVILSNEGAHPELIKNGEQGFLCTKYEEYVNAVKSIDSIDRKACRRLAEERFNTDRMVREYISIYEEVLSGRIF